MSNKFEIKINDKNFVPLNISKIYTGVEVPTENEILQDTDTGLNYIRNKVISKEIYDRQPKTNWFYLDLECGSRGWFPGSIIRGNILQATEVRSEPSESAEILTTIKNAMVQVLDLDALDAQPATPGWYKIRYNIEGYVKVAAVKNLRYDKPF